MFVKNKATGTVLGMYIYSIPCFVIRQNQWGDYRIASAWGFRVARFYEQGMREPLECETGDRAGSTFFMYGLR